MLNGLEIQHKITAVNIALFPERDLTFVVEVVVISANRLKLVSNCEVQEGCPKSYRNWEPKVGKGNPPTSQGCD